MRLGLAAGALSLSWVLLSCTHAVTQTGTQPQAVTQTGTQAHAGTETRTQAGTQPATQARAQAAMQPGTPVGTQAGIPVGTQAAQAATVDAWRRNHDGLPSTATVQDCLGCHEGTSLRAHTSHPFDADYAAAAGRPNASLRTPAEAQQRGAHLPGGRVHCLSCHDPSSPWKSHVALPPGAKVRAALLATTADGDEEPPAPAPPPGSAVNTMPLCQSCHTYGD
jgi:hypothetical protein